MLVRNWMTPNPPVATLSTHVEQALEMLLSRHLRVLPLANDTGRLLGVVNERDVLRNAAHPRRPLGRCISPMVLRGAVRALSVGDSIDEAVRRFCEDERLDALPVVDHEGVAGILTRRAAMHATALEHGWTARQGSVGEPTARSEGASSTTRSYPAPPPCTWQG
jgi:CBS domain-containing protein